MPQLENFQAWISVDNKPLQEYNVEQSADGSQVTCWIASEENKSFTIAWRDTIRSRASMGRTFVDGVKRGVPKGINKKGYKKDPSKENDTAYQRGAATSAGGDRMFMFSKVKLTDEDRFLDIYSEALGEIKLEISYIQKRGQTEMKIDSMHDEGMVHETRKQLAPHHTKLGQEVQGERKPILKVKSQGRPKVFIFKYRPIDVLKASGIVQRVSNFPNTLPTEHISLVEEAEMQDLTHTPDDIDMLDDAQVMSQLLDPEGPDMVSDEGTKAKKVVPKIEDVLKTKYQESKAAIKTENSCMDITTQANQSVQSGISKLSVFVKEEDKKPKIEIKTEVKLERVESVVLETRTSRRALEKRRLARTSNEILDLTEG